MSNFDLFLFDKIHDLWLSFSPVADFLMWFSAKFLMYVLVEGFLLWATLCRNKEERRHRLKVAVLALFAAVFSRFVITEVIRFVYPRPRPFVFFDFYPLIAEPTLNSSSFPSGHAAFFFAFAMIVLIYWQRAGLLFFLAGFLIGFSRIYVGVHWPSDIIFGAALGILVGYVTYLSAFRKRLFEAIVRSGR